MKRTTLTKVLATFLCSLSSLATAKNVNIYHVNGAGVTEEQLKKDVLDIRDAIGYPVEGLKNTHESFTEDVLEFISYHANFDDIFYQRATDYLLSQGYNFEQARIYAEQAVQVVNIMKIKKNTLDGFHVTAEWAENNPSLFYTAIAAIGAIEGTTGYSSQAVEFGFDLYLLKEELLDAPYTAVLHVFLNLAYNNGSAAEQDSAAIVQTIDADIDAGDAVLLLPFGSGNLIAEDAVSSMMQDRANVSITAIATTVTEFPQLASGHYINLVEDIVLTMSGSNTTRKMTNYTDFQQLFGYTTPQKAIVNAAKYGATNALGHDLFDVYLKEGANSLRSIQTSVNDNLLTLQNIPFDYCQECYTDTELPLGSIVSMWTRNDAVSQYSSGYAKNFTYTLTSPVNSACRKMQFAVTSDVDSYINIRANNYQIASDDDSGGSGNARVTQDLQVGTYQIELSGKSLFSSYNRNKFGLDIVDLGECDKPIDDNIFIEGSTVDGKTSNITITHGQEIRMRTYQKYSGTTLNSDLRNPNLHYVFSRDMTLSSSDLIVETDYSTIGSDDVSDVESEYYTIPATLGTGRWYIGFVADADNEIQETNENDNVEWIPVTIEGSSSPEDVYLDEASVSEIIMYVGTEYKFRIKQYYSGHQTNAELPSIKLKYYLSDDFYFSSDDKYLGSDTSSIGSDDAYDIEYFYWTPSSSDKGVKFIIFRADTNDDVNESNEDNNEKIIAVAIRS